MIIKKILITALLLGSTAIVLGAFGSHLFKQYLNPTQLQSYEVGVRYQMYHALFLLFVALHPMLTESSKNTVYWLALLGVLFFSGSIYLLSFKEHIPFSVRFLGPVTPIGGSLLIAAWVVTLVKTIMYQKL